MFRMRKEGPARHVQKHALKFKCGRSASAPKWDMPKYFFEIFRNGQSLGDAWVDLDNLSHMRREALKALHDTAIDEIATSELDESLAVAVRGEDGRPVYSATLNVSQPFGSG